MSSMAEFIRSMPKLELHVHIEGTLEPELRLRLAQRNQVSLEHETVEQVRASYDFQDLPSFLTSYYNGMRVLNTELDFYELTSAYLQRAAAEGIRYVEIFFDPQAHTSRGVSFDTVIRGIRRAALDAERQHGPHTQLIMCFLRDFSAEYAMATLLESLPYREWIVGVGLDSDEHGNPPRKFSEVFQRARQEGYLLTMHCDVDQENSIEHIRQCVREIGVDRIDHGSNIIEDEELVAKVRDQGIGLTTCPVSNNWISDGLKAAEIRRLLDAGLAVTVNSDDPAYFGGYLTENLFALQDSLNLTKEELTALQLNAVRAAWASQSTKDKLQAEINAV